MKALRYHGKDDVRLEEIPEPVLGAGQVRITPAYVGICGSDLHLVQDGPMPPAPSTTEPHPISGETLPVVFGHEFSGRVTEVGEGVDDLRPGESVVVEPYLVDGTCAMCAEGRYNLCDQMGFIGISGGGGGLSESFVVDRRWVHPVGDLPLDEAALMEPLAVAVHAVRLSGATAGETALVGGAGPIGLLTAAVLRARGVMTVVSEISAQRKAKARETGVADHLLDPTEGDVGAQVRALTGGHGADRAFECAGVAAVTGTLLGSLRKGGVLQVVALYSGPIEVDMMPVVINELEVRGAVGYAGDHAEAIRLVREGQIDVRPFITSVIRPEDYLERGIATLRDHNDEAVKILVEMGG